eukprot:CAMPEP_0201571022 /NCGR_PEP_ID=MMETSP0190_2-20130828/13592_1 /ASSEMBLY_ACC=CAM_ASM_000263 /TAXON_ID=37353 /ORGANISM="Rosalina sp." /LENGTH=283 /DNA_ID=CAMNT_0047995249 /DNA_START=20 /DNA_END=871 /DNA_ORIENTATION=+
MSTFAALFALFSIAYSQTSGETGWDLVETTWNINVFAGFYPIELTVDAAKKKNWQQLLTCSDSGSPGNVYTLGGDLSSMPIYNADGYISGMILGMLDPGASSETINKINPYTQYTMSNGTKFWGVEAYFRDPDTICKSGQTKNGDVGDRLWFNNGDGSGNYYKAPLTQNASVLNSTGWELGACFWQMGYHYWRYMSIDMDCDQTYPIFLLYNGGKLNAWGIALAHSDRPDLTSYRWEHPAGSELDYFFQSGEIPKCLPNQGTLSTQHIFLTNPAYDLCPLFSG